MNDDEKIISFQEWKKRNIFRHGQRGYYSLADLPQIASVESSAFSTGWWELDQIFRFYPGQFTIMTGIPGHGKSTLFFNIVCNLVRAGRKSMLYVPEDEPHLRDKLRNIWGNNDDAPLLSSVFVQTSASDLYEEALTLEWVLYQAITPIQRDGVSLLYIDPWNELERAKPKDVALTDYIGQTLMVLKQFARMHEIAVVLVAHPTKAVCNESGVLRTPTLYDIEGSANWNNKCDNGLIIFSEIGEKRARVISAKAKIPGSGRQGKCWFQFDPISERYYPEHGAVT
jgi:twinkle protein